MRIIGLDIHRVFAEAVAWDEGKLKRLGRVDMRRHLLEAFAMKLSRDDVVVVEATGNAASVAAVIAPHVKRVVIANPKQVRIIGYLSQRVRVPLQPPLLLSSRFVRNRARPHGASRARELLGHHRPRQSAQGNRDAPPSAEKQKDRDRNAPGRHRRRRKRPPKSSGYRAGDTKCGPPWDKRNKLSRINPTPWTLLPCRRARDAERRPVRRVRR